jgi:hypothetical protein
MKMSDPLWDEWNRTISGRPTGAWVKYASQYTMRWFVTMQSRDRVIWKDLPEPDPLHERVMKVAYAIYPSESHAPEEVTELRIVCWIDPNREDVPAWLYAGAPDREDLRLV